MIKGNGLHWDCDGRNPNHSVQKSVVNLSMIQAGTDIQGSENCFQSPSLSGQQTGNKPLPFTHIKLKMCS